MVFTLPMSRIPEMAEVLVTMFDPEMTGTFKEPPPRRVIISNVFDHLACEGIMAQIANVEILNPTPAQRATVRNAAVNLAKAMENAQNIFKKFESAGHLRHTSWLMPVALSSTTIHLSCDRKMPMSRHRLCDPCIKHAN